MPVLTCCGSLEARVLGYMNGASLSTKSRSRGSSPPSSSFRTPVSDLSLSKKLNSQLVWVKLIIHSNYWKISTIIMSVCMANSSKNEENWKKIKKNAEKWRKFKKNEKK